MYYTPTMESAIFEAEKNRKAFIYTVIICAIILLLAFLIKWPLLNIAPVPVSQDLIEIDLGAAEGPIEPELGGGGSMAAIPAAKTKQTNEEEDAAQQDASDDVDDKEAAPVIKNPRPSASKNVATKPVVNPVPKAPVAVVKKPAIVMPSGRSNTNTSGTSDDFGNGTGKGTGTGPGTGPGTGGGGGGKGGTSVVKGDRKIVRYYSFTGDLDKATIYAIIKVSPEGRGTFVGFDKNSSSRNQAYANAIRQYLANMQFDKADHESNITVQFNFNVQ